jgi:glucose/mannose transport system permease protein
MPLTLPRAAPSILPRVPTRVLARVLFYCSPRLALLPMAVVAIVGYLGAALWTLRISLTSSRTFPSGHFIGLAQYQRLFDNERWMLSLHNLALYGLLFIAASLVIGFLLAVFIDQKVMGEGLLRTVFLYPYAMSFIATGIVWQWLLTPGGGIDGALRTLGVHVRFDWIVSQDMAIVCIVIATVWQASGLVMAMALAGLRGVDPEIWKATRLDGIPAWRVYLQIVLPMLWPTVATVLLLLATAVAKLYDAVVAMTQGGPGIASEVPAKFIMDHLFLRSNVGLASAGAVTLLLPVLALLAPYAYARAQGRSHVKRTREAA